MCIIFTELIYFLSSSSIGHSTPTFWRYFFAHLISQEAHFILIICRYYLAHSCMILFARATSDRGQRVPHDDDAITTPTISHFNVQITFFFCTIYICIFYSEGHRHRQFLQSTGLADCFVCTLGLKVFFFSLVFFFSGQSTREIHI